MRIAFMSKAHRRESIMPRYRFSKSPRITAILGFFASIATGIAAALALSFAFSMPAAAVEVNSADVSQLETVKGSGPSLSSKIMTARKQGNFKDWSDLEMRVSGIGDKNAAGFSRAGLTVAGKAKDGAPAGTDAGRAAKAGGKKVASASDMALASGTKK